MSISGDAHELVRDQADAEEGPTEAPTADGELNDHGRLAKRLKRVDTTELELWPILSEELP